MTVTIDCGEEFTIYFNTGKQIVLTHQEWMEMRQMQNSLIFTEPN